MTYRDYINWILGLSAVLLAFLGNVHAQGSLHGSQWIFGTEAWVDFSADTLAIRRAPGFKSNDSNTTYADETGKLIWSSDGYAVFNRNFVEVPNGRFYDTLVDGNNSYTQGVLALPDPGTPDQSYALFLGGDYAVIDHRMNAGLGGIVGPPFLRNWHAPSPARGVTEKLTAVRHANGRDWWVLTLIADGWPDTPRTPKLGVALLDPDGIRPLHEAELGLPKTGEPQWHMGEIRASHDGAKLVFSGTGDAGVRLYAFDRCTGLPGPALDSLMLGYPAYCFEYSPNGEIIYLGVGRKLYQWTLNPGQFDSSLYLIAEVPPNYWVTGLKIRKDKIYVSIGHWHPWGSPGFEVSVFNQTLSVIESPDVPGSGCGFNPAALSLDSGLTDWGITDHANYALGALEGSPCDTLSGGSTAVETPSTEAEVVLFPNPAVDGWWLKGLEAGAYRYAVYDAFGREAARGEWRSGELRRIPADGLPKGWYGIRVERNGQLVWRGGALRH